MIQFVVTPGPPKLMDDGSFRLSTILWKMTKTENKENWEYVSRTFLPTIYVLGEKTDQEWLGPIIHDGSFQLKLVQR